MFSMQFWGWGGFCPRGSYYYKRGYGVAVAGHVSLSSLWVLHDMVCFCMAETPPKLTGR